MIHTFYWFQGQSILTWGTLSHRLHMFQQFHLFLASLVMTRKNILLEWFGRGNIDDIETVLNIKKILFECHFLKFVVFCCPFLQMHVSRYRKCYYLYIPYRSWQSSHLLLSLHCSPVSYQLFNLLLSFFLTCMQLSGIIVYVPSITITVSAL